MLVSQYKRLMKGSAGVAVAVVLGALAVTALSVPADAAGVSENVRGRILLDVARNGEAWYVNPFPAERHFLGRPDDAFRVMRELGLGITNADLAKVPEEGSGASGDRAMRARLAGRILLAVESRGEAWYVHPVTQRRHSLGRPADAFRVMRETALGISSADLATVPVAGATVATSSSGSIFHDVPFTAQAPLGIWTDRRYQEGCEESTALMAVRWARGEALSLEEAQREIASMADWERDHYGTHEDTSARDTADRIFKGYFGHHAVEVREGIGIEDVLAALRTDAVVALPVDGRLLGNPYFTPPGPLRHMILVTGYDAATDEFVTHEPGTRRGANYRYSRTVLAGALMDYPSGFHVAIPEGKTAMVVVRMDTR